MSSICGIFRPEGPPVGRGEVSSMLGALDHWGPDRRGEWTEVDVGLGHLMLCDTPESMEETLPFHDPTANLTITADARIDNRAELGSRLDVPARQLATWPDSRLILTAYRRWGSACVEEFLGDFAFAIWDGSARRLFCARDPIGVKPFYYHQSSAGFAFATEMKGLLALKWVGREVDETWIGDLICRIQPEHGYTLYRSIRTLEPAHLMRVEPTGLAKRRYWELSPRKGPRLGTDQDYVQAFRDCFARAVRRRIRSAHAVGAELSGGLDSTGICAVAQRTLQREGRELHTYAYVLPDGPAEGWQPPDERASVELLLRHAGIRHAALLTGEGQGFEEAFQWALRTHDEPPRVTVSLMKDDLFESARVAGVRVLLSGFGGNQGVTGEYATHTFDLIRERRWQALFTELSAAGPAHALRLCAVAVASADLPGVRPALRWRDRKSAFWQKFARRPIRDGLLERLRMRERADAHLAQQRLLGTANHVMAQRLGLPDVAARLEYGALAARGRGIEFRYPMLDVELLELFASVPSHLKRARGQGRLLYRMAMEGVLPDAIRLHAGGASANPGGLARREASRDQLVARMEALPANSRLFTYVDREKLGRPVTLRAGREAVPWRQTLALVTLLTLERKLGEASQT